VKSRDEIYGIESLYFTDSYIYVQIVCTRSICFEKYLGCTLSCPLPARQDVPQDLQECTCLVLSSGVVSAEFLQEFAEFLFQGGIDYNIRLLEQISGAVSFRNGDSVS
jgi:hypothetical protein